MDDKGSTLIVVFGLPPLTHQDDPVRAVMTGLALIRELKKIDCSCSIGISTGIVFAGVIGTSGSRRGTQFFYYSLEYSVLGDSANLAARLMQKSYKSTNKIIVDSETQNCAQHKIMFQFLDKQVLKGKSEPTYMFIPLFQLDDTIIQQEKIIDTHFKIDPSLC